MIRNKIKIFLLLVFISTSAFCQLNQLKWKKADLLYEKPGTQRHRKYSFEADDAGEFIKRSVANAYWFFISDLDGDNCPFRPSCSAFLMQSAEETNIAQGMLMFFDRFTRDMNVYKPHDHYPCVKRGYYYDPPRNYTLNSGKINYLPSEFIVDDE